MNVLEFKIKALILEEKPSKPTRLSALVRALNSGL